MDSNLPLDSDNNTLELTPSALIFLLETAKWSKFLAIVGFIFLGLITLAALGIGYIFGQISTATIDSRGIGSMGGMFVSVFYLLVVILGFFPVYYLFQFSVKTKKAIKNSTTLELTDALRNLKSCFKSCGILTLIIVVYYTLTFVFPLLEGISGML